ncbi:MAG TPA: hypothetical protein VMZ73_00630 [Acidimicrobiales bacterium]|nr:hypothetical protein [Acidimicrobiales bacterium]
MPVPINQLFLEAYVWQRTCRIALHERIVKDEAGEGVISAAIAILVMAFLGVLMWTLFKDTLTKANTNVNDQIDKIK